MTRLRAAFKPVDEMRMDLADPDIAEIYGAARAALEDPRHLLMFCAARLYRDAPDWKNLTGYKNRDGAARALLKRCTRKVTRRLEEKGRGARALHVAFNNRHRSKAPVRPPAQPWDARRRPSIFWQLHGRWLRRKKQKVGAKMMRMLMPALDETVARMAGRLSSYVSRKELAAEALAGVWQALPRLDRAKNPDPMPFLDFRARGAMLDYCRREDYLTRGARKKNASENTPPPLSIEALDNPEPLISAARNAAAPAPEDVLQLSEFRAAFLQAAGQLAPRTREVLRMSFFEDMNLKEIGAVLDLSEVRISQIRKKALQDLAADARIAAFR